ncbi:MAG TPA: histidine phosphatase family protein [Tepidiformaceae bacterium]|nr:histidine phosphatase family protein [Tepidiformaceae bacterium]
MTIFLVRHGETAFNRDGIGLGRQDLALTPAGQLQAAAVAARLAGNNVSRVLSSPLRRAADVAAAVASAHSIPVELMPALIELDIGETEGLELAEMRRRFPDFLSRWASPDGWRERMPGGESIEDMALRLRPLAAVLREDSTGDVVVVSHNFVLRTLLCTLLGLDIGAWRTFQVDLASVTGLTMRHGRAGVQFVNDRCHLSNLNLA